MFFSKNNNRATTADAQVMRHVIAVAILTGITPKQLSDMADDGEEQLRYAAKLLEEFLKGVADKIGRKKKSKK